MKKLYNKRCAGIVLSSVVLIGTVLGHFAFDSYKSSADSGAYGRLQSLRNSTERIEVVAGPDNNSKVVRAIVTLKDNSVAETTDVSEYSLSLKAKEDKVIDNQSEIIKKVEYLTDNKVVSRTGYLVNSFSIDATRKQLNKIAKLEGVESVCEAATYKPCMETALNQGNVTAQLESKDYGYTGEGTVIAIIDTGLNYNHQDMILDESVKTKYTKEEWQEKIELLGHGKYFSEKVPYGYNYITGKDDCLNTSENHGYHVTGIAAGNGEIDGVARNAQVIGMKVFDEECMITSDGLVSAIEDAVKLGADVINMSLGSTAGFVTDEDYVQNAVDAASEKGVLVCISAGNDGMSADDCANNNRAQVQDTGLLSTPGTTLSALTVASCDNKKNPSGHRADNVYMSSFTSWGPTNELDIKPEITAPGGNIKAACGGIDGYETLSGTSMATPFVAGAQAVMVNAIKARGLELKGEELSRYMKNSLVNTADVLYDPSVFVPYSVRRQGAGQVDLYGAVNNYVLATYKGEAEVELGEFEGNKTFDIVLTNYGDKEATYSLEKSQLYKDYIGSEDDNFSYGMRIAKEAYITYDMSQVVVPAKGQVTVKATINIPESLEKDKFIEGFVSFKGNNVENIGLPVLGYYGDWGKLSIMDKPIYEEGDSVLNNLKGSNDYDYGTALTSGYSDELLGVKWKKVSDKDCANQVPAEELNLYDQKIVAKLEKINCLEENVKQNVESVEFEPTKYKIEVKEDGYFTLDFDLSKQVTVRLVEYCKNGTKVNHKRTLIPEAEYEGHLIKEFMLSKDSSYVMCLEAQNVAPQTSIASVKYASSSGENCYKLVKEFKGDAVAFSPNGDALRDTVEPKVLQLRNAKEVKISVLDKDKKVIRKLATLTDVRKMLLDNNSLMPGNKVLADSLMNSLNQEDVIWDGKVYNKQNGEFEDVEDGQYYIQLESKVNLNEEAQVVTMPVKVDRVKPTVEKFEIKNNGNGYVIEFLPKDNVDINDNYYIDIQYTKGAANKTETYTFNNKLVDTPKDESDNYIVDLSNFADCNIKKVTIMIEDMAGNQVFKEYKNSNEVEIDNDEEINEKIKGMGFFKLCKGVAIDRYMRDDLNIEVDDFGGFLIEGECEKDISVFCNGIEAKYATDAMYIYENGKRFGLELKAEDGLNKKNINLVIKKNETEIFSQTYTINILKMKPCKISLVKEDYIKDRKYFEDDMTEVLYMEKDGEGKVSFEVEVSSDVGPFDKYNVDMSNLIDCTGYEDGVGPLTTSIEYQGNNKYKITIDDIENAGSISLNCNYDTYFNGNLNVYVATSKDKYDEIKSGYEFKLVSGITDVFAIEDKMLNPDGTMTIKGKLGTLPSSLAINKNIVNVDSQTCEFSYNLPIKKGLNFINIKAIINGKEISIDKCLHYENVNIVWHDDIREINGVIETDKDVFNLAGSVYSYSNVIGIEVCGETVYSAADTMKTYEDKPFVKAFDYNIELVKGVNKIKFKVVTSANHTVEKNFTINCK